MPKAPMTHEEVEHTRRRILDTALDIIIDEGFSNLSVRKIATRLGVTATTIYNYYTNKDELNLMIRIRGFEILYDLMTVRSSQTTDMENRLGAMVRAYVEFGRIYPSYYDIMFNLHTPKYLDYVGSDIEPVARHEKQKAMKCLTLFVEPISSMISGSGDGKDRFVTEQVVRFWTDLHGLVTLRNSRLLHEVLEDVDGFVERRTEDLIQHILRLKQRIDRGDTLF